MFFFLSIDIEMLEKYLHEIVKICDACPKLLDKLKGESKVKTMEEQGVGAHSLAHITFGVEGRARALGWD